MTSSPRILAAPLLLVLLAGCGGETLRSGDPSDPAPSPGASSPGAGLTEPTGPTAASLTEACPPEADTVLEGQSPDAEVRPDPVAARVCIHPLADAAPEGQEPQPGYHLADTEEAGRLAGLYAKLTPAPEDQICTADIGPTATVLFEYADGSAVAVATELYGCSTSRFTASQEPRFASPDPELRFALSEIAQSAKPFPSPSAS